MKIMCKKILGTQFVCIFPIFVSCIPFIGPQKRKKCNFFNIFVTKLSIKMKLCPKQHFGVFVSVTLYFFAKNYCNHQ